GRFSERPGVADAGRFRRSPLADRADSRGIKVARAARARGDRNAVRTAGRPPEDAGRSGAAGQDHPPADPADRGARTVEAAPATTFEPAGRIRGEVGSVIKAACS